MEPRREEEQPSNAQQKPKRFRVVKLEERLAPKQGGKTNNCSKFNCPFTPAVGCY